MGEERGTDDALRRWANVAKIVAVPVMVAALLGFGTWFYSEFWLNKELTYTVLASYDLEDLAFTGLLVENRGRVTLTDVQIIISGLETPIEVLNMPGSHEPCTLVSGGVSHKEMLLEMPRLSRGTSLSVYMLTSGEVELADKVLVTSRETVGESSAEGGGGSTVARAILVVVAATVAIMQVVTLGQRLMRPMRD